jgi:hypothetical protein
LPGVSTNPVGAAGGPETLTVMTPGTEVLNRDFPDGLLFMGSKGSMG